MSNLSVAAEYKSKIINLLIKNEKFVKLIAPVKNECEDIDIVDTLLGGHWIIGGQKYTEHGHIFDYNFVNDAVVDDKTYAFVETDIDTITDNIYTYFNLYVCVFAGKDLIRLDDYTTPNVKEVKEMGLFAGRIANRIDSLCDVIDSTLNGNEKIPGIGTVQPAPSMHMSIYNPNNKFYGKCLKYQIMNYNPGGDECGWEIHKGNTQKTLNV